MSANETNGSVKRRKPQPKLAEQQGQRQGQSQASQPRRNSSSQPASSHDDSEGHHVLQRAPSRREQLADIRTLWKDLRKFQAFQGFSKDEITDKIKAKKQQFQERVQRATNYVKLNRTRFWGDVRKAVTGDSSLRIRDHAKRKYQVCNFIYFLFFIY